MVEVVLGIPDAGSTKLLEQVLDIRKTVAQGLFTGRKQHHLRRVSWRAFSKISWLRVMPLLFLVRKAAVQILALLPNKKLCTSGRETKFQERALTTMAARKGTSGRRESARDCKPRITLVRQKLEEQFWDALYAGCEATYTWAYKPNRPGAPVWGPMYQGGDDALQALCGR